MPQLNLCPLEDRWCPATAVYTPLTQTLTVTGANNDDLLVTGLIGKPTGYIKVAAGATTVFTSDTAKQPVRNLTVRFGTVDNGSLTIDLTARLGGSLAVTGARTSQTFTNLGIVGGNFTYASGVVSADDDLTFDTSSRIGGNTTINVGGADNTIRLRGGQMFGNLTVTGGTGHDRIEVTAADDVSIAGSASFNLGAGHNQLVSVALDEMEVGGTFSYTGAGGADTIDFDSVGSTLRAGTDARFTLGVAGALDVNTATFEALYVGRNLSVTGAAGDDNFSVSGAMIVGGAMTATMGIGDNTLDLSATGSTPNGVGGALAYSGGANTDVVKLDGLIVGKNLTVLAGDGDFQSIDLGTRGNLGVAVFGSARLEAGVGDDAINLQRTYVGANLTVVSGGGDDTVMVDNLNVAGTSLFDLGAGDDDLMFETLTAANLLGVTSFGSTVVIRGGDGFDDINLSDDDEVTTQVHFGGRITVDGGLKDDSLSNSSTNAFEVTGNVVLSIEVLPVPGLP